MHMRIPQRSLTASLLLFRYCQVTTIVRFLTVDCVMLCGRYYKKVSNGRLVTGSFYRLNCHNLLIGSLFTANWCMGMLEMNPSFVSEITARSERVIIYIFV